MKVINSSNAEEDSLVFVLTQGIDNRNVGNVHRKPLRAKWSGVGITYIVIKVTKPH